MFDNKAPSYRVLMEREDYRKIISFLGVPILPHRVSVAVIRKKSLGSEEDDLFNRL